MSGRKQIEIMESIYDKNEKEALEINSYLTQKGVFAINVLGAPGVGKTTSIMQIIKRLKVTPYVIEGDIASDIDTQKFISLGVKTIQINTGGACHLDSPIIGQMAKKLEAKDGILFIENIGNLVCPAEFQIGEHVKMLILTVTEGSDKPYKYPLAFEKADIILLNKMDLLPYVDFDEDFFLKGLRALNPQVPIIKISGKTGEGFGEVVAWMMTKIHSKPKE